MLFSSLEFLVLFLPLALAVALRLRGQALLRWIALTSVVFYAFAGHWWFIVPMLVTTTVEALLDHREVLPTHSLWPFLSAVAVGALLIASIFSPRAVVPLVLPVAVTMLGWYWPRGPARDAAGAEERPLAREASRLSPETP